MKNERNIYLRGKILWIRYSYRRKERFESSKSDKISDARRLLKKRLGEIGNGRLIGPTEEKVDFEDLANALISDYEINGKRSIRMARIALDHLREWFRDDRALDITTDRISAYTAQRLKDDAKAASVNYELSILRRGFSLMVKAGRLSTRPWIALLEVDNARSGFVDMPDFNRLVGELPEHLKDPVSFLYLSCWRPVEMKTLQWKDVDLKGRAVRLRVEHSKTKKPRLLKLDGRLLAILERAHEARRLDCPFVFHVEGRPLKDFSGSWKAACVKAGLEGLLVYDLRRSGIRNLIRAGVPESVTMRFSGHKTRKMLDRYNIVAEADLDEASIKLDQYLDAQRDEPAKVLPLRAKA